MGGRGDPWNGRVDGGEGEVIGIRDSVRACGTLAPAEIVSSFIQYFLVLHLRDIK